MYLKYSRQLSQQVKQLRDAGEPVTFEDFQKLYPVDEDNSCSVVLNELDSILKEIKILDQQIGDQLEADNWDEIYGGTEAFRIYPELRKKYPEELKAILEKSQPLFEKLHSLREVETLGGLNLRDSFFILPDIPSSEVMQTTRQINLAIIVASESGDYEQSIEYLRDTLQFQDLLLKNDPLLLSYLVTIACRHITTSSLEMVSWDFNDQTIREEARQIINLLLEEDVWRDRLIDSFRLERVYLLELAKLPSSHRIWGGYYRRYFQSQFMVKLTRPLLLRTVTGNLNNLDGMIKASKEKNLSNAKSMLPTAPQPTVWDELFHYISPFSESHLDRVIELNFQCLARSRMAATTLAIRMYQADKGKLPEKLDDLVGKYIPFIPDDPFGQPGAKIKYLRDVDKPRLYCLKEDMTDDGGIIVEDERPNRWPDMVFFIDPKDYPHEEPKKIDPAGKPRFGPMDVMPRPMRPRKSQPTTKPK